MEFLNFSESLLGIEKSTQTRCTNESKENYSFRFNGPSEAVLATSNLFQNGFPADFSILIVARQLSSGKNHKYIFCLIFSIA